MREGLDAPSAQVGRADGDAAAALAGAARRIEADYAVPFLAHATMEPQTCTAHVKPDGVEVWAPSQDAMTTLVTAAVAAGVPNDKVTVHPMMLGGGFGRRNAVQEFVREAVLIAKEVAAAGQDGVEPRTGYRPRSVPAVRHGASGRRPRCRRHADRADDPSRRTVIRGVAGAGVRSAASSTAALSAA